MLYYLFKHWRWQHFYKSFLFIKYSSSNDSKWGTTISQNQRIHQQIAVKFSLLHNLLQVGSVRRKYIAHTSGFQKRLNRVWYHKDDHHRMTVCGKVCSLNKMMTKFDMILANNRTFSTYIQHDDDESKLYICTCTWVYHIQTN